MMHRNSLNDREALPKRKLFLTLSLLVFWLGLSMQTAQAATIPPADPLLLEKAYGMTETLNYEVSWMGLKAGKLIIQLIPDEAAPERFLIKVSAKSAGLLDVLHPVEDNFETIVEGPNRLPTRYDIKIHEGRRRNKKLTIYDQEQGILTYTRDADPSEIYQLAGPVYNEFSSFMIMRALPLVVGQEVMVPTFADKKRHEVMVKVEGMDKVESIFGKIETIRVRPQLPFKGLYRKTGAPVIWLSDDTARIPVKIKAKITIGSITARLVAYQGWKEICKPEPEPEPVKINNDEEPFL